MSKREHSYPSHTPDLKEVFALGRQRGFAEAIEMAAEEILNWGRKDGYEEELVKSIKALKPPQKGDEDAREF